MVDFPAPWGLFVGGLLQNGLRRLVVVSSTGGGLVHVIHSGDVPRGESKVRRERHGTGGLWCVHESVCVYPLGLCVPNAPQ